MADLSWLTKAVNKTRNAQLEQQKMVAIPLFNQIGQSLQNMQSPVTPQVQQLFQTIEQKQRQTPVYIPFKAGTPTLSKQQLTESTRQYNQDFAESQRRYNQEYADQLKQQQFENAIKRQQLALQRQKAQQSASSSSSGLPTTAGERKNYYMAQTYQFYQNELKNLSDQLREQWAEKGRGTGGWSGPTTDDISQKLYDIEQDMIDNMPALREMGMDNYDIMDLFRGQVLSALGKNGEDVYNQWKQNNGKSKDLMSMLTRPQSNANQLFYVPLGGGQ